VANKRRQGIPSSRSWLICPAAVEMSLQISCLSTRAASYRFVSQYTAARFARTAIFLGLGFTVVVRIDERVHLYADQNETPLTRSMHPHDITSAFSLPAVPRRMPRRPGSWSALDTGAALMRKQVRHVSCTTVLTGGIFCRARRFPWTSGNCGQLAQSQPSVPKKGVLASFQEVIPPLP
jgi:hypothetical protein